MVLNYGYINLIDKTPESDLLSNIFQIFTLDPNPNKDNIEVIFEFNDQIVDLKTCVIDKTYKTTYIAKYNSTMPLYISYDSYRKTLFEIDPSNLLLPCSSTLASSKEMLPSHPSVLYSNINWESDKTKIYGHLNKKEIGFGIWKLKNSTSKYQKYLIGWDPETISQDLLYFLLVIIFVDTSK